MLTPIVTVGSSQADAGCCDVFGYGGGTCTCNYQ